MNAILGVCFLFRRRMGIGDGEGRPETMEQLNSEALWPEKCPHEK